MSRVAADDRVSAGSERKCKRNEGLVVRVARDVASGLWVVDENGVALDIREGSRQVALVDPVCEVRTTGHVVELAEKSRAARREPT